MIAALTERGVRRFVYTPVEVDGLMEGPDLDSLREVAGGTDGELIYSGGIGSLDDLRALAGLGLENLEGVIVGTGALRAALHRRRGASRRSAA